MGNESETLELKMHTDEVEAEISGPDNVPPGTAKHPEDEVMIFVLITFGWHGPSQLNVANVMLPLVRRWKSPLTTRD